MKRHSLRAITTSLSTLTAFALVLGTLGVSFGTLVPKAHATEETHSTITLSSGGTTKTAGYTETNPLAAPLALQAASYSPGSFGPAVGTETVIPPWLDPGTESAFGGSSWVSSHSSWPGGTDNTEGSANNDQWRLFTDSFTLPEGATVTSATVSYSADNATEVYLNGSSVGTTNDVYSTTPESGPSNYVQVFTAPLAPTTGENTLQFVVRNWSASESTNPTGLLYKATVEYSTPDAPPSSGTDTVTIVKYIDGAKATAESATNADFPMLATWNAENTGAGSGEYALSASGFSGDPTPYQAITTEMTEGADYSTNEITGGAVVGATCDTDAPYALVGYTTGTSLENASAGTPTMTIPAFTNITEDQFVIVWNKTCDDDSSGSIGGDVSGGVSPDGTLKVTSVTPIDTTATANGTFADGLKYTFNITVPTTETNLSMKFADWMSTVGANVIPVANNMRISSLQANNAGATVLLTAANTYSSPALHMTGDLNSGMPGLQVQVSVEVAVPTGSANGSYTTNYGVQTLP